MDQKGFISRIDTALADLIWASIKNDSSLATIVSSQEQISFSSPKTASARGNKKLSIFLYNMTQEAKAKNSPTHEAESRELANDVSFALHYLITSFTGNEKDDHSLLEKIIQLLIANPLIDTAYAENNVELVVKVDSLSLDELSRLWMALDAPLRLSASLTVSSTVSLHNPQTRTADTTAIPQTQTIETNHLTQLYQAVFKTFTEQAVGWRNRNMLVKQWVFQDFQKNSGMSVDEMQSTLNSLGDKVEHGESATQFIKTLNQLAGYYQHQLDELKGLHKISNKQTENIQTIAAWIKDINDLAEALAVKKI